MIACIPCLLARNDLLLYIMMKVLGIDIGIGIFNTYQMGKSIDVLGIQLNFFGIMVLGIQYFKKVLTHTLVFSFIMASYLNPLIPPCMAMNHFYMSV